MKGREVGAKIQSAFDWIADALSEVENRWLVFIAAVLLLLVLRALGAQGLSTMLALVYIMYFVTIRLPDRDL